MIQEIENPLVKAYREKSATLEARLAVEGPSDELRRDALKMRKAFVAMLRFEADGTIDACDFGIPDHAAVVASIRATALAHFIEQGQPDLRVELNAISNRWFEIDVFDRDENLLSTFPVDLSDRIIARGEWKAGRKYDRADAVQHDGVLWIAQADNPDTAPRSGSDWKRASDLQQSEGLPH